MQVLHLTLYPCVPIAVVGDRVVDLLLVVVVRVRGREAWIDVLRNDTELFVSARGKAQEVSLFQGPILVQGSTNKVGAVRKVWGV